MFAGDDGSAELNGLTIGAGTPYRWRAWPTGLGVPEIRSADTVRARRDGVTPGDDYLGARTIVFEIDVEGTIAEQEALLTDLSAAFAPGPTTTLQLRWGGNPAEYVLHGRPRGCEWMLSRRSTVGLGDARCVFLATDPIKYGGEQTVRSTLAGSVVPLTLPFTLPATLGTKSGNDVTVANTGSTPVDWTATIVGPVTTPRLRCLTTGKHLQFDLDLGSGEELTLDSSAAFAAVDDVAALGALLFGSSWGKAPVGNSTWRLDAGAGTGYADITYRPGWL